MKLGFPMRADRLLVLLALLQVGGRVTTSRLAKELEVSRRTVIRDLYALRVAGIPVIAERGPHGGCALDPEFRNRLLSLNRAELAALLMASVPQPLVQLGVASDLKGALAKLAASRPGAASGFDESAQARVHLDSVPWSAPQEPVEHLAALYQGVAESRWMHVTLQRAQDVRSGRRIAPYGLVAKVTTWYVVWAGEDGSLRVDRVSRFLKAHLEQGRFVRPQGFDLAAYWRAWCQRVEANQMLFSVTARVSPEGLAGLNTWGTARTVQLVEEPVPPGSARPHVVRIAFGSIEEARTQLLALGGSVEVLQPLALRRALADFAQQTLRVYGEEHIV